MEKDVNEYLDMHVSLVPHKAVDIKTARFTPINSKKGLYDVYPPVLNRDGFTECIDCFEKVVSVLQNTNTLGDLGFKAFPKGLLNTGKTVMTLSQHRFYVIDIETMVGPSGMQTPYVIGVTKYSNGCFRDKLY